MSAMTKRIEELNVPDLQAAPVWQYANSDRRGETVVRPVVKTPVKNLTGRVVGTQVRLANGTNVWALIGNVDASNPRLTQHFLTLSVLRDGRWFTMARYHDFDAGERGPKALSEFLGMPTHQVFPVSYNIRHASQGDPDALAGTIESEPREKLTRAQVIALAVP